MPHQQKQALSVHGNFAQLLADEGALRRNVAGDYLEAPVAHGMNRRSAGPPEMAEHRVHYRRAHRHGHVDAELSGDVVELGAFGQRNRLRHAERLEVGRRHEVAVEARRDGDHQVACVQPLVAYEVLVGYVAAEDADAHEALLGLAAVALVGIHEKYLAADRKPAHYRLERTLRRPVALQLLHDEGADAPRAEDDYAPGDAAVLSGHEMRKFAYVVRRRYDAYLVSRLKLRLAIRQNRAVGVFKIGDKAVPAGDCGDIPELDADEFAFRRDPELSYAEAAAEIGDIADDAIVHGTLDGRSRLHIGIQHRVYAERQRRVGARRIVGLVADAGYL